LLNYIKITLISKDSKLNIEEDVKEKLIIMQEKEWSPKIKINITLQNIDLLSELPQTKLSVK
jgi:hypothetical protein